MINIFQLKVPERYSVSRVENSILQDGVIFKRAGEYKKADEVYEMLIKTYGESGIVFAAWAKNLACQGRYEEAIHLFQIANSSCVNEYGDEDPNYVRHAETLKNRDSISEKDFLLYMRSIAGNQNYTFKKI